jgi:hypothetical protein
MDGKALGYWQKQISCRLAFRVVLNVIGIHEAWFLSSPYEVEDTACAVARQGRRPKFKEGAFFSEFLPV